MTAENIFNLLAAGAGLFSLLMAFSNLLFMIIKTRKPLSTSGPLVSVLIPVRNEENYIPACLDSLLEQTYANYEIIVVDDDSSDRTPDILKQYSVKNERLKVYSGSPLPSGWYGKNHALCQLTYAAEGEILLFTDADTIHSPESISFAVSNIEYHGVDFLSGYPKQLSRSRSNAPLRSLIFLNLLFFNPVWSHLRFPVPFFSLVLGQYFAVRASALRAAGGYEAIPDVLTDDIHMGRLLVKHGYRQVFLRVGQVVSCRMYPDMASAMNGISKCMFAFFDHHLVPLLILMPLFTASVVLPFWVLAATVAAGGSVSPLLLFSVLSIFFSWGAIQTANHFSPVVALIYPWSFVLLLFMLLRAVAVTLSNRGFRWKDRTVK